MDFPKTWGIGRFVSQGRGGRGVLAIYKYMHMFLLVNFLAFRIEVYGFWVSG